MAKPPPMHAESEADYEARITREGWYQRLAGARSRIAAPGIALHDEAERRRPALVAATQASAAVAQLLQVATEGGGFGDEPVVALLAEALALSIDLHLEREVEACDTEYRAGLTELRAVADRFLEAWAG